jgi:hypothetical protein
VSPQEEEAMRLGRLHILPGAGRVAQAWSWRVSPQIHETALEKSACQQRGAQSLPFQCAFNASPGGGGPALRSRKGVPVLQTALYRHVSVDF